MSPPVTGISQRRGVTQMLPPGFRERTDLPQPAPPRWMKVTWIVSLVATLVMVVLTLIGPMDESVLAAGVVRPADYELAFPRATGVVAEVMAHPGEQVEQGEVLARLDSFDLDRQEADLAAELAQAQAVLAAAEAQRDGSIKAPLAPELLFQAQGIERQQQVVQLRQGLLQRMESLGEGNNVSLIELTRERLLLKSAEQDLDRARQARSLLDGGYAQTQQVSSAAQADAARAKVAALNGRRSLLDNDRERRLVRAPAAGLVVSRTVRFPGEQVVVGTALFKLSLSDRTQLRLYASEDRVNRIKPGMVVRFRPRSDPDRLRPMSVGRIEDVALDRDLAREDSERADRRGSYVIDVAVDNAATELPLGAAVDAEIVLGERPFWRILLLKRE